MRRLPVNGITMSYAVDEPERPQLPGGADGPPLVLLHGFPLDARIWAGVAHLTGRRVTTIRPNLRGFGSLTNMDAFTIDALAEDVWALLKSLALLPCVLGGLSMGGYVALAFADRFAGDLRGLALVDTKAEADDEAGRRRRDETVALLRRGGVTAVAEAMHPRMLAPATYAARPETADALMRIMRDTPAPTVEQATIAMRDRPNRTAVLARIDVPSLVLVGESDAITPPDQARRMAERLPSSRLVVVPDAGHLAPLEQPEAVAEALLDLMERVGA